MQNIDRHTLAKVTDNLTSLSRWVVLCFKCRNSIPNRYISFSELPCSECGAVYIPPRGQNLKVGQVTHIIHATYPDIERALNAVPDAPEPDETDTGEPWDTLNAT